MPEAYGVAPTVSRSSRSSDIVYLQLPDPHIILEMCVNLSIGRQQTFQALEMSSIKVRAGFDLLLVNIGFTYSNRYTAYGTEQIVGVGVGLF